MPKARRKSAKKLRKLNKKYYGNRKSKCFVTDHEELSCDATEPIVLSDARECNDGSVYDHTVALCDVTQFTLACASEDEKYTRKNQLSEPIDLLYAPEYNDGSVDLPDAPEHNDGSVQWRSWN
uniref:Uncharacterized protein n=1 Tax=Amphimedon queenslandica TaxID=400682 RepID=A0A1X7SXN0_AMPQE